MRDVQIRVTVTTAVKTVFFNGQAFGIVDGLRSQPQQIALMQPDEGN